MNTTWHSIILENQPPTVAWNEIFSALLSIAESASSPVALHNDTVIPDRLLSEAAWELWASYSECANRTSTALKAWCADSGTSGRAVLIMDALSLRETPFLLQGAKAHGLQPANATVTGSECPSTTDQFAQALGLPSRSALTNDKKPGTFALFSKVGLYTDVMNLPFEDCPVPPVPNLVIWHTWLDDLIHLAGKSAEQQIPGAAASALHGDGFWNFVNRLRQGRDLVITSDHGYAVSRLFSSEVKDPEVIKILRETFSATRYKKIDRTIPGPPIFFPPLVLTDSAHHVIVGQRKWTIQGGFPPVCHGGLTLLETAVPWLEFGPL